jgi:hypothetical protein
MRFFAFSFLISVSDFLMRLYAFWPLIRCLCEILCVLLYNLRMRYPDEISCFFWPLRALSMRFHACLAVMRFLDEISGFLACEYSF